MRLTRLGYAEDTVDEVRDGGVEGTAHGGTIPS